MTRLRRSPSSRGRPFSARLVLVLFALPAFVGLTSPTSCGRRPDSSGGQTVSGVSGLPDTATAPPANRAPTITCSSEGQRIPIKSKLLIQAEASDPDGDALTYTWRSSAGEILGTGPRVEYVAGKTPGIYTVQVMASDGEGHSASCSVEIQVLPPPRSKNGGGAEEQIPEFPWPPPQWTSHYEVPTQLISTSSADTLGQMFDGIKQVLTKAEIQEWSTYAVGPDGFAVVMRLECIGDDGTPKAGAERWCTPDQPGRRKIFDLGDYIQALFTAQTGRYRVIVLLVTSRTLVRTQTLTSSEQMKTLVRSGADRLPDAMRTTVPPASRRVIALVYEFFRESAEDQAKLVTSSVIQPSDHLIGANLWPREALQP